MKLEKMIPEPTARFSGRGLLIPHSAAKFKVILHVMDGFRLYAQFKMSPGQTISWLFLTNFVIQCKYPLRLLVTMIKLIYCTFVLN